MCYLNYIYVKFSHLYVLVIAIFQKNKHIKILKSEAKLNMLLGHRIYINRANKMFCRGSYQELNYFCFAEFLAYYTPVS